MKKKLKSHVVEKKLLDYLKKLPENSFLPPERKLAEDLNVSRSTLRKALETITSQGFIHRISGKGNIVSVPANSEDGGARLSAGISLFMPSGFIAPYISKMLAGWDDVMKKNNKCYVLHGSSNPHQQLYNIKGMLSSSRLMVLSLIPWSRNILSPMPDLAQFKGDLVFLLDRHTSFPELGHAIVNNEQKGAELALKKLKSARNFPGNILYFHRSGTHYSSEEARLESVAGTAKSMGIGLEVVETSYRTRRTIKDRISGVPRPASILCSDAFLAAEVVMASNETGRLVPDDVSLVSLFDTPTEYNVSHVHIDYYTIGQLAGNLAVNMLENKTPQAKNISVEPSIMEGTTTC